MSDLRMRRRQPPAHETGMSRSTVGREALPRSVEVSPCRDAWYPGHIAVAATRRCSSLPMTPQEPTRMSKTGGGIAARAGRWSARHKKTAILGWLAFIIVALIAGNMAGTKEP